MGEVLNTRILSYDQPGTRPTRTSSTRVTHEVAVRWLSVPHAHTGRGLVALLVVPHVNQIHACSCTRPRPRAHKQAGVRSRLPRLTPPPPSSSTCTSLSALPPSKTSTQTLSTRARATLTGPGATELCPSRGSWTRKRMRANPTSASGVRARAGASYTGYRGTARSTP